MATTARKKKNPTAKAPKAKRVSRKQPVKRKVITAKAQPAVEVVGAGMSVKGGNLVVPISQDTHPEIFDLDALSKHVRKMIGIYSRKKRTRDLVKFLAETEKSLQIMLKNHLEDAMREYLN